MQLLPDVKQFLKEHQIETDDGELLQFYARMYDPLEKVMIHEDYMNYRFAYTMINQIFVNDLIQFLLAKNTATSIFTLGDIYYDNPQHCDLTQSVAYYKQSYDMDNMNGCYWIARCYKKIPGCEHLYLKYLGLSCDKHNDPIGYRDMGSVFYRGTFGIEQDFRAARYYYNAYKSDKRSLSKSDAEDLCEMELNLLSEFKTKLVPSDYLLAYELKVIHDKPGLKDLQKLIENEYSNVLDLLKDLSNIVVSYLLYEK